MAALWNRAGHYIFPCGFFLLSFFLSFYLLFSSPNLSRHRLDHTILAHMHGVALVQISDAGLKRATRGSMQIQDAKVVKNRHLGTIVGLYLRN